MPETELSTANSSAAESDIHKENTSKRKHLETNLQYVTVTLEKNSTFHTQQNNKIMKENVTLIQEINSLKKEKHKLNLQIRELKVPDQT
jgi:flagellar hook-associated protein FlgK